MNMAWTAKPSGRRLVPDDASAWFALRVEMLQESPHSFLASPEDDSWSSVAVTRERLAGERDDAIFGLFEEETLVGAVGIFREPHLKTRHRIWIWGVYLRPAWRGKGHATRLMEEAAAYGGCLGGRAPDLSFGQC